MDRGGGGGEKGAENETENRDLPCRKRLSFSSPPLPFRKSVCGRSRREGMPAANKLSAVTPRPSTGSPRLTPSNEEAQRRPTCWAHATPPRLRPAPPARTGESRGCKQASRPAMTARAEAAVAGGSGRLVPRPGPARRPSTNSCSVRRQLLAGHKNMSIITDSKDLLQHLNCAF